MHISPLPLPWDAILWWAITMSATLFFLLNRKKQKKASTPTPEQPTQEQNLNQMQEEIDEMSKGYSSMALLIEEIHMQISDLQKHGDELEQRLNVLERPIDLHLSLTQVPWCQECADGEEEDENNEQEKDSDTLTLPQPLPGWVEFAQEGLDQL